MDIVIMDVETVWLEQYMKRELRTILCKKSNIKNLSKLLTKDISKNMLVINYRPLLIPRIMRRGEMVIHRFYILPHAEVFKICEEPYYKEYCYFFMNINIIICYNKYVDSFFDNTINRYYFKLLLHKIGIK